MLIPTMSKDMDDLLKLVQLLDDVVDRPWKNLCDPAA